MRDGPPEWLTNSMFRNVYATIAQRQVPDVPYEEWLDHWLGRRVASQFYPWFDDRPDVIFRPGMANAYALRLFTNAAADLEYFHDDQIGAGLRLLIDDDDIYLAHPDVPAEQREGCLLAMVDLFRDLFASRCGRFMSNGSNEPHILNGTCYMWWESLTHIAFPGDPHFPRMRDLCFDVMEATLEIPHVAVQESALHGLGHTVRESDRAHDIIERFLRRPDVDPDVEDYARAALTGCIQ